MSEDLIYYNSRWRHAALTAGSLVFVAMGIWLIIQGKTGVGLMTSLFFGMGVGVGVWQFLDTRPRLRISDKGILDRTLGVGVIRWADIENAYVRSINHESFICLLLRNEEAYASQLSPLKRKLQAANQALGFTPFSVNLSGVDLNPEQLLEYILKQAALAQAADTGLSTN
jgi:hypothetical protein